MRNIIILIAAVASMSMPKDLVARSREVQITCSDQNADVHANGKYMGKGNLTVIVRKEVDLTVTVSLPGHLSESRTFYYRSGMPVEKSYHFTLRPDDAIEASSGSEWANTYITINSTKPEDVAWKTIGIIVRTYFSIFESSDHVAGYIRTAWAKDNYTQSTVRTQVIVEQASIDPLSYRVKLVSEIANKPNVGAKDDEKFRTWDRMLRKYENMMSELQTRLK
jgi:hypothetical protein